MNTLIWHEVFRDCFYFIRAESNQLFRYLGLCIGISTLFLIITYYVPASQQNPAFAIAYMFVQILLLCGSLIFINAVTHKEYLSPIQALTQALPRLLSFIGVSILTGICTAIGFIFLIVPGIYVNARLLVADMCAVLAEKKSPLPAMRTSMEFTKGHSLQLAILVAISLAFFLALIFTTIANSQNLNLIQELIETVLSWFIYFYWIIVRYRCYMLLKNQQRDL